MARIIHYNGPDGWTWFNGEPGDGGQDHPTAEEMAEYEGWYVEVDDASVADRIGPFDTKAQAIADQKRAHRPMPLAYRMRPDYALRECGHGVSLFQPCEWCDSEALNQRR